jgi:hypothetical protein
MIDIKQEVIQEPGTPEAGLQQDIFGGYTEVRPKGKGEVQQASLFEFGKLVTWKEEAKQ